MGSLAFTAILNTQIAVKIELEDAELLELITSDENEVNESIITMVRDLLEMDRVEFRDMDLVELLTPSQARMRVKRTPPPKEESDEEIAEEEPKRRNSEIENNPEKATDNWTIGSWKTIPGVDPSCALWDWEPKEGKPTKFMIWYHRGESTVTKYPAEEREQTFKWLSMLFPDPTE